MTPTNDVCDMNLSHGYINVSGINKDKIFNGEENTVDKSKKLQLLVGETLFQQISDISPEHCEPGEEDPFFVVDLGAVCRSLRRWKECLPDVHPYYAVKCNPNETVIKLLGSMGCNFDCASQNEVEKILLMGFGPERIVYANPSKTSSHIRYAKDKNVLLTTVDSAHELLKLHKYHPDCGVLIRISTDDETAQCRLSTKFGCTVSEAEGTLLPLASKLGLCVRGVAFHVGSGAKDLDSIRKAIRDARVVFDSAINIYGYGESMNVLDIGGGFESDSFSDASLVVNKALDHYFPKAFRASTKINLIAEPGRFMVADAFTLAVHVIGRKDVPRDLKQHHDVEALLYLNDGVYGNLNCILFDHQQPCPKVLLHKGQLCHHLLLNFDLRFHQCYNFSLWGPTCDGLDCVSPSCLFPTDVHVGDWIYFPNLGAYSNAASTSFNGFSNNTRIIYVSSE